MQNNWKALILTDGARLVNNFELNNFQLMLFMEKKLLNKNKNNNLHSMLTP